MINAVFLVALILHPLQLALPHSFSDFSGGSDYHKAKIAIKKGKKSVSEFQLF
uniref:Uncharacterized protein n=1 Tax=Yersinia ruckeri TaxID=29486 RepID=A0A0A8VE96_YERRU|nr:hypothetical protein CSF007_4500 [Yersinia ruckeri]